MPGGEPTDGVSQEGVLEPQEQPGSPAGASLETLLAGSQPFQQRGHSRLEATPAVTRAGTADPYTKTKSNSIPHTKIKLISTPLLKLSQFAPDSKIKPTSMPPHKNQVNFGPYTKTKFFSTPTPKPSQFRSLH